MSRTFWTIHGLFFLTTLVVTPAHAHISLEKGGTHKSRYGDADTAIKEAPCGQAGGVRGTNVYTYEPGSTITVTLVEAVPHPSYFRFAFDDDGDDGFKDPVSILPIDPTRKCPDDPTDHCGASDFYNTPAVLPNMDDLLPHIPTLADTFNPPVRSWQVTLPNVECDNCTLQVIQVMEDDAFPGPYDTTPGVGVADVYHQCIDLVLKGAGPQGAAGAPTGSAGVAGGIAAGGTTSDPIPTGGAGANGAAGGSPVSGSPGAGGTGTTIGGAGGPGATSPGIGGGNGAGATPSSSSAGSCTVAPRSRRQGSSAGWMALTLGLGLGPVARRRRRS